MRRRVKMTKAPRMLADLQNQVLDLIKKAPFENWINPGVVAGCFYVFCFGFRMENAVLPRPTIWRILPLTSSPGIP